MKLSIPLYGIKHYANLVLTDLDIVYAFYSLIWDYVPTGVYLITHTRTVAFYSLIWDQTN